MAPERAGKANAKRLRGKLQQAVRNEFLNQPQF